jgi:acetyl-CoA hydrolase
MLADHVEKNNLQGQLKYSLFVGASSGAETENRWADLNMIERRSPHQVGKAIAKGINNGNIKFFDKHLSMFPVDLVYVSRVQTFTHIRRKWMWLETEMFEA